MKRIEWWHLVVVFGILSLIWMRMYFHMKTQFLDCIGG